MQFLTLKRKIFLSQRGQSTKSTEIQFCWPSTLNVIFHTSLRLFWHLFVQQLNCESGSTKHEILKLWRLFNFESRKNAPNPLHSGVNIAELTFRDMKWQHCQINFTRFYDNCQIQSQLQMQKNLGKTLPAVSSSKTIQFASTPGTLT